MRPRMVTKMNKMHGRFFAARSLITCKLVQVANIPTAIGNDGQPLRELAGVADKFAP